MDKRIITFDPSLKNEILSIFDKDIDSEGLIVEKANPHQRVVTPEGEEITLDEFAGISKGSEIFIKSDIDSLVAFSKTEKQ